MAWPGQTADDFLSGEPSGSESSITFRQALYDRDVEVAKRRTYFDIQEASFTDTSLTSQYVKRVRVPPWAMTGDVITLVIRFKHSAGSVNGSARLDETDTATSGSAASPALTTSYQEVSLTLTVPDDTWAGTLKTFDVLCSVPSGTGTITTELMGPNLQFGAS